MKVAGIILMLASLIWFIWLIYSALTTGNPVVIACSIIIFGCLMVQAWAVGRAMGK